MISSIPGDVRGDMIGWSLANRNSRISHDRGEDTPTPM